MVQTSEIYEDVLSPQSTDNCSEKVRAYVSSLNLPGKEASRYALTVEEILLDSAENGECEKIRLSTGKKFFRSCITLELFGKQQNIFRKNSSGSFLGDSILKNLGLSPEYSYSDNVNTYLFRIKKKALNPFMTLAIVIIGAVLLGVIGKAFFSAGLINGIINSVINPLHDAFLSMLTCVAGPMIFLSVSWGIYGIGDAATLKKIGKRLMRSYVGLVYLVTVIFSLILIPVFGITVTSGNSGSTELSSIFKTILGIIPKNIVSPFMEGNTLQIIFLAVIFGAAMLFLGQKTTAVARAIEQINCIVTYLIEIISKIVPYFIFLVILSLIWSDSASSLSSVSKYIIAPIVCIILCGIARVVISGLRMKTNPVELAKKGFSTFIIALTTASSAAAFGNNMNTCRRQYGIDDTISSFGLPLGIVACKPSTAIVYVSAALFFSSVYHVEISVSWMITLIFSAGILAIATPPIPGGAMTAYTVLFAQMGIPADAIAIALACDALFDFVSTGFDQYGIPLTILPQANKLGLVDMNILKSKAGKKQSK